MLFCKKNAIPLLICALAFMFAGALLFQQLGYAPCKLCYFQRYPHVIAIVIGVFGITMPHKIWFYAGAAALATTSGIGFYRAGVELGYWPGPDTCTGANGGLGGLSGADLLSTANVGAIVMCDEISWRFLGLSMAMWNGILSALLMLGRLCAARANAQHI